MPQAVRRWRAEAQVLAAKPPRVAAPDSPSGIQPAGMLWPGMQQAELEQVLKPLQATAVIAIK